MKNGEKGAVIVESALVAAVMFVFIFGFIDMSLRMVAASSLQSAALTATRAIAATGSEEVALEAARNRMPSFLRQCLSLRNWRAYEALPSVDFISEDGGMEYEPPLNPAWRAIGFEAVCNWEYTTITMRNLLGAKAEIRTWSIAVLPH